MITSKIPQTFGKVLSLWLAFGFGTFCPAVDHSPQWTGTTYLSYGLLDLDEFDPKAYYYCKWGNPMSSTFDFTFNRQTFFLTPLTEGPFNNQNNDLFLSDTDTLNRRPFPEDSFWTTDPLQLRIRSYFNDYVCFRYLHFRNELLDSVSDSPVDSSTRKLVILIHGWNPKSNEDSFAGESFQLLENNLHFALEGFDWGLVKYHWEPDADTGSLDLGRNPTEAAEISHQHGQHLGELLHAICPNLEKVQLIAHSAGSWAARSTARYLLQFFPNIIVQVTLLDPFMPDEIGANSSLGEPVMSKADSLPSSERLYLLDNYYADELTFGTQEVFAWRTDDLNVRVDWPSYSLNQYYNSHDGPIDWYTDSIYATYSANVPDSLAPFQLTQVGWQRSLFFNEPLLMTEPQGITVTSRETITLAVGATTRFHFRNGLSPTAFTYQWRKNGVNLQSATSSVLEIPDADVDDSGEYSVVVSNSAGQVVSGPAMVEVRSATRPRLTVSRLANGTLEVRVTGDAGATFRVETSTDLRTWTLLTTEQAPNGSFIFTENPTDGPSRRFYRVVVQP